MAPLAAVFDLVEAVAARWRYRTTRTFIENLNKIGAFWGGGFIFLELFFHVKLLNGFLCSIKILNTIRVPSDHLVFIFPQRSQAKRK